MLAKIVDSIPWHKIGKSLGDANIDPLRWLDEPLCRVIGFFFMARPDMTIEEAIEKARERNKILKAQREEELDRWQYH